MNVAKGFIYWKVPNEFRELMKSWEHAHKSPYSNSYYDVEEGKKDWNRTPEGCCRISDHWNFKSNGENHCCTDVNVKTGNWTLAIWDKDHYKIIKTLPPRNLWELNKIEVSQLDIKFQRSYWKIKREK